MSGFQYDDNGYMIGDGTFTLNGHKVEYKTLEIPGGWYLYVTRDDVTCSGTVFFSYHNRFLSFHDYLNCNPHNTDEDFQFLYGDDESKIPILQFKSVLVKND